MSTIILKHTTRGSSLKSPSSNMTVRANQGTFPLSSKAYIEWNQDDSSFYFHSENVDIDTIVGVRVSSVRNFQWELLDECYFSFGSNVFKSYGMIKTDTLKIECLQGCRKGEEFLVSKEGASIGRASVSISSRVMSSAFVVYFILLSGLHFLICNPLFFFQDNTICIQDPEISRHHLVIVYESIGTFDEGPFRVGQFHIIDECSKLGTFMLLRGPHYQSPHKLKYDDQIVLGKYHFSINRFDYGSYDHIGFKPRMESFSIIRQDLDIEALWHTSYFPVSYFAIYDGRNGKEASEFLFQNLHYKIRDGMNKISPDILRLFTQHVTLEPTSLDEKEDGKVSDRNSEIDELIIIMIKNVFFDIDRRFLFLSQRHQGHQGSSAIVTIIMGDRVFAINIGDSNILLSRNFQAFPLSKQHFPLRKDEMLRIESCPGGFIAHNCVQGLLPVSRGIGYGDMKKYLCVNIDGDSNESKMFSTLTRQSMKIDSSASLILCEPEIEVQRLESRDQFLVLCCNGLLGVFKRPQVLIDLVKYTMIDMNGNTQKCASKVVEIARKQMSAPTNLSLIVILIHKWF